MALSLLLSLSLAVPAGLLAAYRAGQSIDKLLSALAALLLSAPSFMLGLVLMFFLALTLKWLRAVGYVPLSEGILGNLRSFAIPVLTLALIEWPVFMRINALADYSEAIRLDPSQPESYINRGHILSRPCGGCVDCIGVVAETPAVAVTGTPGVRLI